MLINSSLSTIAQQNLGFIGENDFAIHKIMAYPCEFSNQKNPRGISVQNVKKKITLTDNDLDASDWYIISNGQYVTHFDLKWVFENIDMGNVEVLSLIVDPTIGDRQEVTVFAGNGQVAGFEPHCQATVFQPLCYRCLS